MRSHRLPRVLAPLSPLMFSGVLLLGCENESARARSEAQIVIQEAAADLREASLQVNAVDPEHRDAARAAFENVVTRLQGVSGEHVAPGQQAGASMMIATAQQALASMLVQDAIDLAEDNAAARASANTHLSTVIMLDALAGSTQSVDLSQIRDQLAQQRAALLQEHAALVQEAEALAGPISELEQTRGEDVSESQRLRAEAERLLNEARQSSYTEGMPIYLEATDRRREADQYDTSIALKELDLDYDLRPKQAWSQRQADRRQRLLDQLEAMRGQLDTIESALQQDVSATRSALSQMREELDEQLTTLNRRSLEEIGPLYEQAAEHLRQAADAGSQAAASMGGATGDGAVLLATSAQTALAQARLAQAADLAANHSLLQRAASARDVFDDVTRYEQLADRSQALSDEAKTEAVQALEAAESSLQGMNSRDNQAAISRLRQSVGLLLRGARGEEIDPSELNMTAGISPESSAGMGAGSDVAAPASVPSITGTQGLQSPDELVQLLNAGDGLQATGRLAAALRTQNVELAKFMNVSAAAAGVMNDFIAAVRENFDAATAAQFEQGMGAGAMDMMPTNPRIASENETAAAVTVDLPTGASGNYTLEFIDGAWWVTGMPMSDAELQQIGMMTPMLEQMISSFQNATQRIRSGEITTPEQLQQALSTEISPLGGGM